MESINLRDKCKINTNYNEDNFVGVKATDGDITINFPIGYRLSKDDHELRRDVLLLFNVLSQNVDKRISEILKSSENEQDVQFPLQAYIAVISDYISRGIFKEHEYVYQSVNRGRINWKRTINSQQAYEDNGNIFYLKHVSKVNSHKDSELITLVHEYIVHDSFMKIGWLFNSGFTRKPTIKFNQRIFTSAIYRKLQHTYNDKDKLLLHNMLRIIDHLGDTKSSLNFKFGTYRFEYVWEKMIDRVFGVENKSHYFPYTMWNIKGVVNTNTSLEPDTIMLQDGDVYVLDAKYYKFGLTRKVIDLPETSSIHKQITYGEYIYKTKLDSKVNTVYSAFVLPWASNNIETDLYDVIGEAVSLWKSNSIPYQRVVGVLMDVKYLMQKNIKQEKQEINRLAEKIKSQI
jgi:hypothetical protein